MHGVCALPIIIMKNTTWNNRLVWLLRVHSIVMQCNIHSFGYIILTDKLNVCIVWCMNLKFRVKEIQSEFTRIY